MLTDSNQSDQLSVFGQKELSPLGKSLDLFFSFTDSARILFRRDAAKDHPLNYFKVLRRQEARAVEDGKSKSARFKPVGALGLIPSLWNSFRDC